MKKKIITTILFLFCSLVSMTFISFSKDDNPAENVNPYKICWKTDAKAYKDNFFLVEEPEMHLRLIFIVECLGYGQ